MGLILQFRHPLSLFCSGDSWRIVTFVCDKMHRQDLSSRIRLFPSALGSLIRNQRPARRPKMSHSSSWGACALKPMAFVAAMVIILLPKGGQAQTSAPSDNVFEMPGVFRITRSEEHTSELQSL